MARPVIGVAVRDRQPPGSAAQKVAHRLDLDGLRGVAIMLVACFHIWFGRVSGGVDVFLVLSGYFLSAHCCERSPRPSRRW